MGLVSAGLAVVLVAISIAVPLAGAWWWSRRSGAHTVGWVRIRRGLGVLVTCVAAQLLAVSTGFVLINDHYGFYVNFRDLLGKSGGTTAITVNGHENASDGRVEALTIHGRSSHTTEQALAWLPPQYDETAYRHHRFPVVEFLPGQPGYPDSTFQRFELGARASQAIAHGVHPFVLVVAPVMVRPPKDTECTNVPSGPRALSWLVRDVPHGISSQLRVDPPGRNWSMIGWSTGGFCAAKVLLTAPHLFSAAASLGGYYQPITEATVPHLFGGSHRLRLANSPQWLYTHGGGTHGDRLLMIAGRQDPESWGSTRKMIAATRDDPDVSHVAFPTGGHNLRDYSAYLPSVLRWVADAGAAA